MPGGEVLQYLFSQFCLLVGIRAFPSGDLLYLAYLSHSAHVFLTAHSISGTQRGPEKCVHTEICRHVEKDRGGNFGTER